MIGTKITITDELARTVGKLTAEQPTSTAVTIAWDDDYPEREWLVHFDAGYGTTTYVVDDQTGDSRLAGMGEGRKLT